MLAFAGIQGVVVDRQVARVGPVLRDVIDAGKAGPANASWLTAWKEVQNDPVAAVVNMETYKENFQRQMQRAPGNKFFITVAPFYLKSKAVSFGGTLNKQLKMKYVVDCENEEAVGMVKEIVDALIFRNDIKEKVTAS